MKILSLSVYFYLFFSLLFSHSTKATASQKVIEPEDGFTSLEEKNKAVVRVHKSHIGQGSGFFIGDSETLVISTYMLDVFTLLSNIDSSEQPRGNSLNSHLREGLEIPVLLKSNHSKSSEDLRQFLIASHLKTIAVIHEGNILNLRITGIALSSKDSIAVLKVKGYTGPYLQISDSLIHKDSEFYAASVQSKELTVIKGRNIPQKQRPRQITIAGDQLTLNSIIGSPLLNRDGKVVGVITENFSNFIFASRIGHLTSLLRKPSLRPAHFDELKMTIINDITQLYKNAKEGDLWAMYMVGMGMKYKAENAQNPTNAYQTYRKSASWFQKAANHNFSPALLQLGLLFYFGLGLPKDQKTAALLFQKAAQDSTIAQFLSGLIQYKGIGISENKKNALFLLKKAAENGLLLAQLLLFEVFNNDNSDPKHKEKAAFYFREAKKQNVTLAQFGEQGIKEIISQSRFIFAPPRCQTGFE